MQKIWKHYPGYIEARHKVLSQSLDKDLELLDNLFGRDNLTYNATDNEVKQEALRQLEIEWRSERDELAEYILLIAKNRKTYL